ncbi:hypothetical protein RHECNPAF_2530078 [Rhizobium etli CNPAF512]|nr:hypothetical protein RHECNPAF_2530078 [Rhizobium etli CNPAF512]
MAARLYQEQPVYAVCHLPHHPRRPAARHGHIWPDRLNHLHRIAFAHLPGADAIARRTPRSERQAQMFQLAIFERVSVRCF